MAVGVIFSRWDLLLQDYVDMCYQKDVIHNRSDGELRSNETELNIDGVLLAEPQYCFRLLKRLCASNYLTVSYCITTPQLSLVSKVLIACVNELWCFLAQKCFNKLCPPPPFFEILPVLKVHNLLQKSFEHILDSLQWCRRFAFCKEIASGLFEKFAYNKFRNVHNLISCWYFEIRDQVQVLMQLFSLRNRLL